MGTSSRRRSRALAATVAFTALGVVAPASASAESVVIEGPPPPEVVQAFANCPELDRFDLEALYCLKLSAYDGELKIGSTIARIDDPIEVVVGIGVGTDPEGNFLTEIVPADSDSSGGGPSAVAIPGGLLGMPALDPVLELLGDVLTVSASPLMGTPGVGATPGQDPFSANLAFIEWLAGASVLDVTVNLPLSIRLNNLLLGSRCTIGEFTFGLTTGTTQPPEGIEPMSGEHGAFVHSFYADGGFNRFTRVGSRLVDNTFAVPAATKCDLLVGDLLDQPAGLLDPLVSGQTGLPSPAGNNHASFSVDTDLVEYSMLTSAQASPSTLDFGQVSVGSSSEAQVVTVEAMGPSHATLVGSSTLSGSSGINYQIVSDGCAEQILAPGDQCMIEVRFAPTSTGSKSALLRIPMGSSTGAVSLRGRGI